MRLLNDKFGSMRKEAFFVNDFVHIYNRGNRKQEIVRDEADREYFLDALFYFNNKKTPPVPLSFIRKSNYGNTVNRFIWQPHWPARDPLVKILAFILLDNHFHLLIQEINDGGTTAFMRKFATGITNRFNTKYNETGRLFQGAYKAKRVDSENYLRYLSIYIQIKNAFEVHPKGSQYAVEHFDEAYVFATRYPYGSLAVYTKNRECPIVDTDDLRDIFIHESEYKEFARGALPFMHFDTKKCTLDVRG